MCDQHCVAAVAIVALVIVVVVAVVVVMTYAASHSSQTMFDYEQLLLWLLFLFGVMTTATIAKFGVSVILAKLANI